MATSANEKWQAWVDKHWPKADDGLRRVLWAMWCDAIKVGRTIEKERAAGERPTRAVKPREGA